MQYLLSEEEYEALAQGIITAHKGSERIIQELCTQVADLKPITRPWAPNVCTPWGCVITAEKNGRNHHYCDNCPVQEVCPYPHKHWSK